MCLPAESGRSSDKEEGNEVNGQLRGGVCLFEPRFKRILGLPSCDMAAILGVNTMNFFLEEFTWK